jgi:hypothetical protein
MNKTEIFICECNSPEHQFIISGDEDNIYLTPHLSTYLNFFQRCVLAVKYIFGHKSRYGSFDSVVLSKQDVKKLILSLQNF